MEEINQIKENQKSKFWNGIGGKLIFMGGVIGILLIGLLIISGQLSSREDTYQNAQHEISKSAGGILHIDGPFFVVPYRKTWEEKVYKNSTQFTETRVLNGYEYIPAESVNMDFNFDTETRPVGIYSAPIFTGKANVNAVFNVQVPADMGGVVYYPSKAVLCVLTQNTSLMERPVLNVNNTNYDTDFFNFDGVWALGTKIPLTSGKFTLSTKLDLRGAIRFAYKISSKDTKVSVNSDWKSPGFTGFTFLPDFRKISDEGFSAQWHIPFGSTETDQNIGVDFVEPVNIYQKLHRAITYGFLFIIVPFLVLFLFEIFAKINLHPVQYLLSGAATVLFFLLLLAISEHALFEPSYIVAAVAASVTVSLYVISITKKYALGLIMMLMFTLLYTFLFFSLRSEDYALLLGSLFAFGILAGIMYVTRKVDWYNIAKK